MTEGTTPDQATTPPLDGPPPPPVDGPPPVDIASIAAPPVRPAPKPASRLTLALSWVTALIIAGFAGWQSGMRAAEGGTAYRLGVAFGTALFPFLIRGCRADRLLPTALRRRRHQDIPPIAMVPVDRGAAGRADGSRRHRGPGTPGAGRRRDRHARECPVHASRDRSPRTVQQIEQGLREDPRPVPWPCGRWSGPTGSASVLMARGREPSQGRDRRSRQGYAGELRSGSDHRNDRRARGGDHHRAGRGPRDVDGRAGALLGVCP